MSLLLCLAGCATATPTPARSGDAPPPLVVSPTNFTAALLPRAEAERVFRWPASSVPTLIFVYDEGEG
ncbi:MAG: hypothetical protein U0641_01395 [Anaerolineae bacterium]